MRSDTSAPSSSSSQQPSTVPNPPMSYSQRFQVGLAGGTNVFSDPPRDKTSTTAHVGDKNTHLDKLYYQISDGFKILVLMRGLPGSGKSTLARKLIEKASLDPAQHIVSADDYFTDKWGNYSFDRSRLPEAHQECQNRVKSLMIKNFAPIIVDNTNIRLWEMEQYCVNAVDHGYIVQILEPTTSWAKNADECFRRNSHGVPFDTILNARKSYERIKNGQELLDHFHLPWRIQLQMRELPPIIRSPEPEPEASAVKSFSPIQNTDDIVVDSEEIVRPNPFENFNWQAHEREVSLFWQENILTAGSEEEKNLTTKVGKLHSTPKPQRVKKGDDTVAVTEESLCNKLLSALKDDNGDKRPTATWEENKSTEVATTKAKSMIPHSVGCPNEDETFAEVRLVFPTVSIQYLWDLFEKCQGDANWMMNIMLSATEDPDNIPGGDAGEDLQCNCGSSTPVIDPTAPGTSSSAKSMGRPLPQRQQRKKAQKTVDPQAEQMKREIEERIRIGDEFYTENMKKVREWKNKKKATTTTEQDVPSSSVTTSNRSEDDFEDDDEDDDFEAAEDVFEFRLGSEFINQLEGLFNTNSDGLDFHKFRPNVFMKRSLAKQIYHLWVESMMYQLEEQKLDALKDDEEIARQINELDEMKSQVKFSDVTQMASAMQAYVCNNDWANGGGTDLALKLKRQKLYEIFPNVNRGVIDETLRQNEDNYERVVETLNNVYEQNAEERLVEQKNKLILAAKIEADKIPKQSTPVILSKPLTTGDAKRDALREFEENRNKAMHHHQFRQECHQKAQEANQKRNPEVAYYYLQIAKLHHHKVDYYNHLAANSIVNVHDLTHNNAELIDLHYLLVQEAIPCLEVFLDSHIIRLRVKKLPYKQIFIITGRGLHSVAGFPTIKVNVTNYLTKRGLRYTEVNPGLLRVKIYQNSRTTE